ncbi:MAG: hypothetical protein HQL47_06945 [Gammaproteobacteria bacterium]|nr:hypothetical protein [Gammaproteobacteria bacterium]
MNREQYQQKKPTPELQTMSSPPSKLKRLLPVLRLPRTLAQTLAQTPKLLLRQNLA